MAVCYSLGGIKVRGQEVCARCHSVWSDHCVDMFGGYFKKTYHKTCVSLVHLFFHHVYMPTHPRPTSPSTHPLVWVASSCLSKL